MSVPVICASKEALYYLSPVESEWKRRIVNASEIRDDSIVVVLAICFCYYVK